jgi:hypothetical protein
LALYARRIKAERLPHHLHSPRMRQAALTLGPVELRQLGHAFVGVIATFTASPFSFQLTQNRG